MKQQCIIISRLMLLKKCKQRKFNNTLNSTTQLSSITALTIRTQSEENIYTQQSGLTFSSGNTITLQ